MRLFKRISKRALLVSALLISAKVMMIAGAVTTNSTSVSIAPQAPPTSANALTTVLGYLQWLGIVGGVGVGALLAGIKIAMMHDMEGGKRDLIYSVLGGIIISLIAVVLNLFI